MQDVFDRLNPAHKFLTVTENLQKVIKTFKFHSCFNASAFVVISDKLLAFAVTLHRLKFPANERVHIASVLLVTLLQYQQHLSFHNI